MSSTLLDLSRLLKSAGAPILSNALKTAAGALGGPAAAAITGAVLGALAEALGVEATPEAVAKKIEADPPAAAPVVADVESSAADLLPLWLVEAQRRAEAEATEMEVGFDAWQFWKNGWQALIVGGWAAILTVALFGGSLGVASSAPLKDVIETWGSVTMLWFAVYNGGHTLKAIAPALGFGRLGGAGTR